MIRASVSMPERTAIGAVALWALISLALIAWNAVRNPMAARQQLLDARLQEVEFVPAELSEPDEAPLKDQREAITKKTALWRPLVAAPVAREAAPDLAEKLKDVLPTRQQVVKGGSLSIKVRVGADDRQGRWMAVGDQVNGAAIKEITPDAVVFSVQQNGKEYTAELRRR